MVIFSFSNSLKKYFYFILIVAFLFSIIYVYNGYRNSSSANIAKFDFYLLNSIQRESLVLGGKIMFGFGTPTESPYPEMPYQVPQPKFYVAVAEPDGYCVADMCGLEGTSIKTMDGWLQVYNTKFVETKEFFEFDLSKNKEMSSMVIVSDQNGKIIGIYPNKGLTDVMDILKLHPDLANFDLLSVK